MTLDPDDSQFTAYHDSMLGPEELRAVRKRLAAEPETRRAYDDLCRTVSTLRRLPEPKPPAEFWPDTMSRLRAQALADAPARAGMLPLQRPLLVALAVAVCLLALLTALRPWASPVESGFTQRSTAAEKAPQRPGRTR